MRVLVVGYGGREHALVWKLRQSPGVKEIFSAAGNAGIAAIADCVPIDAPNVVELADFAAGLNMDLTVVGPEVALDLGIVNEFQKRNLKIFGPTESAAEIETSKVFAKEFMKKHGIPTANFRIANTPGEAVKILKGRELGYPVVLKADGLAAGKGVFVCDDEKTGKEAIETIMQSRKFGKSGDRIVIEEYLEGEEISFHAISDGKRVLPLATSQDHKRLLDGDKGPNTGGMGAYSPALNVSKDLHVQVMNEIVLPTISGMADEGRPYSGVLYAGLMVTKNGPVVLEYNCRFGDPETQCLLPRMECDFAEVLMAAVQGRLDDVRVEWKKEACVCVVLCSEGYPEKTITGKDISGLDEKGMMDGVTVFHAGTRVEDGRYVTSGGRVMGVTAIDPHLSIAIDLAYQAVKKIHFEGMQFRQDIGKKALDHFKH